MEKNKENEKMDILVLTTGGTIEKTYDENRGSLDNKESIVKNMLLSRLRLPYTRLHMKEVMNKDSLDMTDADRALLLENVEVAFSKKWPIVILHGTDTIEISAAYLQKFLKSLPVPVVMTGAMRPLGFLDSDASQNVTEALLASKILAPGVYISFHNRIFKAPNVRKNKEAGTFEFVSLS